MPEDKTATEPTATDVFVINCCCCCCYYYFKLITRVRELSFITTIIAFFFFSLVVSFRLKSLTAHADFESPSDSLLYSFIWSDNTQKSRQDMDI